MQNQRIKKRKIASAALVVLIIGLVVFVIMVLPAKFGADPTGMGKYLGINDPNGDAVSVDTIPPVEIFTQQSAKLLKLEDGGSSPDIAVPDEANNPAPERQLKFREDTLLINIPAGKGIEYKIKMLKYGRVKYEWTTDQGIVFFDFHGEVKQANPPDDVYYESYTVAYSNNMIGSFLAPFEGKHGWYFKNRSEQEILINMRLKGEYALIN